LSKSDSDAFLAAAGSARTLATGDRLAAEGEKAAGLCIVLSGILKSCRTLQSGQAQTLALFTTGDIVGAQSVALGREPVTVAAVSLARVAPIPSRRLQNLLRDHPGLSHALWRVMAREAAVLQEWMLGMGRRTAHAQIAHLLCEIAVRMRLAGRAHGNVYDFPLTQAEVADAVGLSPVHVNRVLQSLRAEGLIALARGKLRIGDWRRLASAAEFDPTYLGMLPLSGDQHAPLLLPSGEFQGTGGRRDREPLPQR
jgi:CRP-like cAMP-binding protein